MPIELKMLVWSVALTILQMLIAALGAQMQVGLPPLAGNRDNMPPLEGFAGRAQRAHRNMLENLVLFAALVLTAQALNRFDATTALGAQLFFWARLVYAPVYWVGVPWLRTVGVGMPTRDTMPRIWSSVRVARMALPTPVSCRFARRPTSVNIRIAWGEGCWAT